MAAGSCAAVCGEQPANAHGQEGRLAHYPDGEQLALDFAGDADLVLLDIDMPRLNGLDTARRLRDRGIDAPLCLGAGIRPTFFVDGSRLGFINDFDLCTLIGNAADNAIEATSQLPLGEAREFSLSVTYRNDIAIIHCQNRFRGAIAGNGPLPRTTKGGDAADLV